MLGTERLGTRRSAAQAGANAAGAGKVHGLHRKASGAACRGVLLALLGGAALVLAVFARGDAEARRIVPLALPIAEASLWEQERVDFAAKLVRGYRIDAAVANEFTGWILEASVRQRLEPELVASLVMTESSFRKHVRSPMGAVGPAQVRADLWSAFCGGSLHDPEQNVYCGAQILAHYMEACARVSNADREQAEHCALRSYNVGFGNRNNVYFVDAAARYLAKIDRYLTPLTQA